MKVYVLMHCFEYEGGELLDVYATLKDALSAAEEMNKYGDGITIEEFHKSWDGRDLWIVNPPAYIRGEWVQIEEKEVVK